MKAYKAGFNNKVSQYTESKGSILVTKKNYTNG